MTPSDAAGARTLRAYNALLVALALPLTIQRLIRRLRRREKYEFDFQRWTPPPKVECLSAHYVLVALSWGEIPGLKILTEALEAAETGAVVTWALRDPVARAAVAERYPHQSVVPLPFDFSVPTEAWLRAINPDAVVFYEKFWFPNLAWATRLRGRKVAFVNGRSRGRKKLTYRFLTGYQRWILGAFDTMLFIDEGQIEKVRDVLPPNAKVSAPGNVKFARESIEPPPGAPEIDAWLANRAKGPDGQPLPLLAAGSTHHIDEEWLLEIWPEIQKTRPCCLLIAPRAPRRFDEVAQRWITAGYPVSRRTAPTPDANILFLDSMNELAYAYKPALAAYVGGAVSGRGHNILEPIAWGLPVAYGPNRGDFEAVQLAAEHHGIGTRVNSADELKTFFVRALTDENFINEVPAHGEALFRANQETLHTVVGELTRLLRPS